MYTQNNSILSKYISISHSGAFVDLELIIVTVQLAKTSAQRVKD